MNCFIKAYNMLSHIVVKPFFLSLSRYIYNRYVLDFRRFFVFCSFCVGLTIFFRKKLKFLKTRKIIWRILNMNWDEKCHEILKISLKYWIIKPKLIKRNETFSRNGSLIDFLPKLKRHFKSKFINKNFLLNFWASLFDIDFLF